MELEYEFNDRQSLINMLHNSESHIEYLQFKLKLLTGCGDYGLCDSTNGGCVDCFYENKELNEKCYEFHKLLHEEWQKYLQEKEKKKNDRKEPEPF